MEIESFGVENGASVSFPPSNLSRRGGVPVDRQDPDLTIIKLTQLENLKQTLLAILEIAETMAKCSVDIDPRMNVQYSWSLWAPTKNFLSMP